MKALIIIDMYNADVNGRKDKNKLIKNQLALIQAFKNRKYPVIFTQGNGTGRPNPVTQKLWGDEYAGTSKNKREAKKQQIYNLTTVNELLKTKPDLIIGKNEYSAFYKTPLERYCKQKNITELYFGGISSGCCVSFTAVDAVYRHIQPILITDASGAPSPERHKMNIDNFKTFMGPAMSTSQVIKKLTV